MRGKIIEMGMLGDVCIDETETLFTFPTISFKLVLNISRFSDCGVYPGNSIGTGDRISEHA